MLGDRLQHCREGVGAGKQPADAACLYLLASQTSPVTHTCWAADQWLQVVLADEEGCIAGLLGNKLRLNPEWSNPQGGWLWVVVGAGSRTGITILRPFQCFCLTVQGQCVLLFAGEWLVGAKAAYELFPAGLKSRLQVGCGYCLSAVLQAVGSARHVSLTCPTAALPQRERKKRWAEKQRAAVADAVAAAAKFWKEHPGGVSGLSDELKKEREELEARVKLLAELDEKYEDLGEAAAAVAPCTVVLTLVVFPWGGTGSADC